ncbi:uncharacterized protein FFMR_05551 [Fusarium fujikuroi]|nr:uncharacterized protein FFMR_05551 [Fusarium fujikuroi]
MARDTISLTIIEVKGKKKDYYNK